MSKRHHTIILVPHAHARLRKWRVTNLQIGMAVGALLALVSVGAFSVWSYFPREAHTINPAVQPAITNDPAPSLRVEASLRELQAASIAIRMNLHDLQPDQGHEVLAFEDSERARALNAASGGSPLSFREVQKLLDAQTALLSYWLGEENSYLWIIRQDSLESHKLPPRREIEKTARQAYTALSESSQQAPRVSSDLAVEALGRMLLDGVALRPNERLVVVSDGALRSLPFAALPDPSWGLRPLIVGHEIVTLPSASVLATLRHAAEMRPRPPNLIAVFADPVFETDDPRILGGGNAVGRDVATPRSAKANLGMPRLAYSGQEAEDILRLASQGNNLKALGFEANRDLVLSGVLSRFKVLHFATHGLFDATNPERSALVLSLMDDQGRRREGLLRASEIEKLDLKADLVVLSACQTGLGKEVSGEGLMGLTTSFLTAGSSSVVATFWNVNDRATAELMTRFYRGMLTQGLHPAAALRQAQVSMLSDPRWAAPTYWAGFVLQGDWR